MKIKIDLDTDDLNPNEKGEFLRNYIFNQKKDERGYRLRGCYATFELNNGFVKIKPKKYPMLYKEIISDAMNKKDAKRIQAYENDKII